MVLSRLSSESGIGQLVCEIEYEKLKSSPVFFLAWFLGQFSFSKSRAERTLGSCKHV